jgi:tetratricopeptide (TPR) repeat protein
VYKHPSLHANLAKANAATGAGESGLKVLRDMKKEFRGNSGADLYAAMTASVLHQDMGNSEEAERSMAEARDLYAHLGVDASAELSLDMAKACAHMGDLDKAKGLVQQAVKNNHAEELFLKDVSFAIGNMGLADDPEIFIGDIKREVVKLNNKGVEMAKAGYLKEAMELFEEAVKGMTSNKVVNLNAARIFMLYMQSTEVTDTMLGQVREYLDRVRRMDPDNRTLHRMQAMFKKLARS